MKGKARHHALLSFFWITSKRLTRPATVTLGLFLMYRWAFIRAQWLRHLRATVDNRQKWELLFTVKQFVAQQCYRTGLYVHLKMKTWHPNSLLNMVWWKYQEGRKRHIDDLLYFKAARYLLMTSDTVPDICNYFWYITNINILTTLFRRRIPEKNTYNSI